jgi:cell division protein FtsA
MATRKRKKTGPFITGVDLGTSKICIVIAELTDDGIDILSVSSSPSSGLRKGIVVNTESAAAAIRDALATAREQSGLSTREALVSISGNHIQTVTGMASVAVSGKAVSREDIDKVIDAAGHAPSSTGREIIHVLPTDFIIDGGRGIKDPLGIPGSRLEAKVNIITASTEPLQRLVTSCEKAGLQVADLVLQSIASAESALSAEDREMGTALVDIGGGTTDIALFKDGWMQHATVLSIGGNHFTNDLSVGLKVSFAEAERLKKQYGVLVETGDDEEIDVIGIDGRGEVVKKVSKKLIIDILHFRAEELLELIKKEIARLEGQDVVTGTVFTGGGVLIPSFERFAENILSMPVRVGYPDLAPKNVSQSALSLPSITGVKEQFNSPQFAAGIGMMLYGVGFVAGRQYPSEGDLFTKMTGFLRNIIGRSK